MKKKIRKPRDYEMLLFTCTCGKHHGIKYSVDDCKSTKNIKKLHKWFTRAIAYLEQEKGKRNDSQRII